MALNYKLGNHLVRSISNKLNINYKELVVSMMRGFKMDAKFLETYRIRMPTPMLYLLAMRYNHTPSTHLGSPSSSITTFIRRRRS